MEFQKRIVLGKKSEDESPLALQKCAICAILLHRENIWNPLNPGIFVKITLMHKKKNAKPGWLTRLSLRHVMFCRVHFFFVHVRCSEAFLWGFHSSPLSLWGIPGYKTFPRIYYQIFGGYQFVFPGLWGDAWEVRVRGKGCFGKTIARGKKFWMQESPLMTVERWNWKVSRD